MPVAVEALGRRAHALVELRDDAVAGDRRCRSCGDDALAGHESAAAKVSALAGRGRPAAFGAP